VPKASELKKGSVVEIGGDLYVVKQIDVKSPSSRGATTLYKVRFFNAQTKQKYEDTFKGDDNLTDVALQRRKLQYSYADGEALVFMDEEDYTQYGIPIVDLEYEKDYIIEGLGGIVGLIVDDHILGIELPQSVVMDIADTAPAIKGATATGRTKPATFATGLVVQVPEYLAVGDRVKINTQDGKFMSRA